MSLANEFWTENGFGGALRTERHYDGREMLCFSDRPANLAEMFDQLVRRFPERPAVVDDQTITYRDLDVLVEKTGAGLQRLGTARGDRVAMLLGNRIEFLACTLACNRIGAIAVPIGTRLQKPELEFILNDCGAKIFIFEAGLANSVPEAAQVPCEHMLAVDGLAKSALPFSKLSSPEGEARRADLSEEDIAVILYTSGTTGRPKGAQLTHLGIIHSAITFARCVGLTENDRGLVAVPLSHVTGLVGVAFSTIIAGGCLVVMRQAFKVPDFLALTEREKVTFSILVPTIYTLCVMSPRLSEFDLSAWRVGCFGGAPMPLPTIELLAEKLPHLELLNAYGATETTSPSTIMPRAYWRDQIDSIGATVPCGVIKIADDSGNELPRGESGELLIAGPMVVPGYWNRPEANKSEFVDGFWRSGDIGTMDAEGFVRVFDRKKDMINRGGFKIFSAEVEDVIASLDGVLECAVIGRDDPVLGQRVHADVVIAKDTPVTPDQVRQFCAVRLSDYKTPETVTVRTDPLPRNANGKVLKSELRKLVAS